MTTGFRLTAATGIHKGDREYQQDQIALLQHPRAAGCLLGVVADGMGGRSGGRKASDQVMLTAKQLFGGFSPVHDDPRSFLRQLVEESHLVIKLTAISAEEEPHSTIAAFLLMPGGACHWVHAGDSRVYHFRGKALAQRTKDHSYVQTLVDAGALTEMQAQDHPESNILVGCLGSEAAPPADLYSIEQLEAGDTVMACTDGLWHYFTTQELGAALDALAPREAAEFLVDKARRRAQGGGDNLSLVIVKVEPLLD